MISQIVRSGLCQKGAANCKEGCTTAVFVVAAAPPCRIPDLEASSGTHCPSQLRNFEVNPFPTPLFTKTNLSPAAQAGVWTVPAKKFKTHRTAHGARARVALSVLQSVTLNRCPAMNRFLRIFSLSFLFQPKTKAARRRPQAPSLKDRCPLGTEEGGVSIVSVDICEGECS